MSHEDTNLVRNQWASRPIDIEQHSVFGLGTFNYNVYRDSSGEVLSPDSLTAVEQGHIYMVEVDDRVATISCPSRIADGITAHFLRGQQVRNLDPGLLRYAMGKPGVPIHQVKALKFRWSMPTASYARFKKRVVAAGGRVVEEQQGAEVVDEAVNLCFSLAADIDSMVLRIVEKTNQGADEEALRNAHKEVGELHELVATMDKRVCETTALFSRAFSRAEARDDQKAGAALELSIERLQRHREALPDRDTLRRLEEAILARLRGEEAKMTLPLRSALGRLQAVYPVLARIQVNGDDEIEMELGDTNVILRPQSMTVMGSPLQPGSHKFESYVEEDNIADRLDHVFDQFGAYAASIEERSTQ